MPKSAACAPSALPPDPVRRLLSKAGGDLAMAQVVRQDPRGNATLWQLTDTRYRQWYAKWHATSESHRAEVIFYEHLGPRLPGRVAPLAAHDTDTQWLLISALPGAAVHQMSPAHRGGPLLDQRVDQFRQAGRLLTELAALTPPDALRGSPPADWAGRRQAMLEQAARLHLTRPQVEALVRATEHEPRMADMRVCHGDYTCRNWVWVPASRRLVLLDFGRAHAGHRLSDLALCEYRLLPQEHPDVKAAFYAGLGGAPSGEDLADCRALAALDAVAALTEGGQRQDADTLREGQIVLARLCREKRNRPPVVSRPRRRTIPGDFDVEELRSMRPSALALRSPTAGEEARLQEHGAQQASRGVGLSGLAALVQPALWAAAQDVPAPARAVTHGLYLTGLVSRPQLCLQVYIQYFTPLLRAVSELWAQGLSPSQVAACLNVTVAQVQAEMTKLRAAAERASRYLTCPVPGSQPDETLVRAAWSAGLLSPAGSGAVRRLVTAAKPGPSAGVVELTPARRSVLPGYVWGEARQDTARRLHLTAAAHSQRLRQLERSLRPVLGADKKMSRQQVTHAALVNGSIHPPARQGSLPLTPPERTALRAWLYGSSLPEAVLTQRLARVFRELTRSAWISGAPEGAALEGRRVMALWSLGVLNARNTPDTAPPQHPVLRPRRSPAHWSSTAVQAARRPPDVGAALRDVQLVRVQSASVIWRAALESGRRVAVKRGWSSMEARWAGHAPAYEAEVLKRLGARAQWGYLPGRTSTWCLRDWHEGEDLFGAARAGLPRLLTAAAGAAGALAALHEQGWVHADMAPEHVVLDECGVTRLLDLAVAQSRGAQQLPEEVRYPYPGANARYEPPEMSLGVLEGEPPAPTRAGDTYSWGASVHHAVTGHPPTDAPPPYTAESYTLFRRATVAGRRHGARVPGLLGEAVEAALSPDPDTRPSLKEIADILAPALCFQD
ncbi:phosphotransferase [Streptomyces sp. NPDC007088]|uniref:phosphotransferase n=1 Tax=Streptomyces sp. NPDC007088 TaxID=3364773 RepID=UPI0036BE047C